MKFGHTGFYSALAFNIYIYIYILSYRLYFIEYIEVYLFIFYTVIDRTSSEYVHKLSRSVVDHI